MKNSSSKVGRPSPCLSVGSCVGMPCLNHKPIMAHIGSADAANTCIRASEVSVSPFEELLSATVSSVSKSSVDMVNGENRIGRSRSIHTSTILSCDLEALLVT